MSAEQVEIINFLQLPAMFLLIQSRTFFSARIHCWLTSSFCRAVALPLCPHPVFLQGLFPSHAQEIAEFQEVPVDPFFLPVQVPLNGSSGLDHNWSPLPSLVSPASLSSKDSIAFSRSSINVF